ncbi:MAG: DUF5119 domain-containing protein [Bacteroidales bacterium]|nr:DUF5119 domain-containing protein [Bacteroidales bacterium]
MNKIYRIFALIAIVVLAAVSCERRPLVDPTGSVSIRVAVNIRAVANVTTTVYNEKIPVPDLITNSMRVMIYDPETKARLGESIISSKSTDASGNQVLSGNLDITHGDYDLLIFNEFDTPRTKVTAVASEKTILAYTDDITAETRARYGIGTSKAEGDSTSIANDLANIEIKEEPDHLVVAHEQNLHISPHDTVVVIHTTASTIVDTYYIQIHVTGMKFANTATAVISGLSPSNHFGLGERTNKPATAVCFPLVKSQDEKTIGENQDVLCAVFNTFGKIPEVTSNLYVTFNVIDTAGKLQQKEINLDQIFKTEDAIVRHWLLIDETWEIKDPGTDNPSTGGGGFQPQVDDWDEEEGNITL